MKSAARPFRLSSYWISLALLLAAMLLSIGVGSVFIQPLTLFRVLWLRLSGQGMPDDLRTFATIIFDLRMPRTFLVLLTGAALAGSGGAYQGLFRNPLADPYLIGVASGAGLGAVAAMSLRWQNNSVGMFIVPLAAFLGAVLTVSVAYELARVGRTLPTTNLILAGVAVSSFTTALTSFLMINASGDLRRAVVWLLGGSTMSGWQPVLALLPYTVLGMGTLLTMGHALNVLQFGDEQAQQLGLPVQRVRLIIIVAATLTTAVAVSFSGIIGFVGLVVPHLVRMLWTGDYKHLIPLSILCGGSGLLLADILARVLIAPQELPTGTITALVGAPFFLYVLRRAKQQHLW
jgi:iron complex transport system permease protein